jgi:spore coat polysaccharide biosynthesis protein SpsF
MSDNTRTTIVLFARTGSSRLPGKVLMPILDRPMLALQIERLKQARVPDQIIVATSDQAADDLIVDLARTEDIKFYRGSEEHWARRILEAGQADGAEIIIRVMGDCPLFGRRFGPARLRRLRRDRTQTLLSPGYGL